MSDDLNYRFALAHAEQLATVGAKRRGRGVVPTSVRRGKAAPEPEGATVTFGVRSGRSLLAAAGAVPPERPLSERIADAVSEFDTSTGPDHVAGVSTISGIDYAVESFEPLPPPTGNRGQRRAELAKRKARRRA